MIQGFVLELPPPQQNADDTYKSIYSYVNKARAISVFLQRPFKYLS